MRFSMPSRSTVARHVLRFESRLLPLFSCVAALSTLLAALALGPTRTLYVPAIFAVVWIITYVIAVRSLRDHHDTP